MQVGVALVGYDLVQVISDSPDVAVDRPLIVIQDNDHALGLVSYVVERLKADPVGKGSIPREGDDVLFRARQVPRDRHPKGGGECRSRMSCPVAVMVAFR